MPSSFLNSSKAFDSSRAGPTSAARYSLSSLRHLPSLMTAPAIVLAIAIATHAAGRAAALCGPHKADSYTYAIAAYKFWMPGSTFADLVPDKPAGQALLTGWCYRLWPGPPTRMTLVPIESLFLLGGIGIFAWLAMRLFERRAAIAMTLFFVIAHNTYNISDIVTDGFNLNESYLALPMLTAVFAHLTIARPLRRGLVRGFGIGLALTIKQTAIGLLGVLVIHGVVCALIRKRWSEAVTAGLASVVGIAAAGAPLATSLWTRSWLFGHLHDLNRLSGGHVGAMEGALRDWHYLLPLAPALWWIMLGAAAFFAARLPEATSEARPPTSRVSQAAFVLLWLAAELAILCWMVMPAAHYYQQIVAPVVLTAGFGISSLARAVGRLRTRDRAAAWGWVSAGTIVLVVIAAMPLWAEAWKRVHTFRYQVEIDEFRSRVENWDPRVFDFTVTRPNHGTRP